MEGERLDIMYRFSGKWITDDGFCDKQSYCPCGEDSAERDAERDVHILFRGTFFSAGKRRVYIYYSADDYCKIYINGRFVVCGPAPSYPFHMRYARKDITKFLKCGKNLIAIHSYYQGLINRAWFSGDGRHGVIFDVVSDKKILICSDESIRVRRHSGFIPSHIAGYDTQFIEDYDSRSTEDGFEGENYDDSAWNFARVRRMTDYVLFPSGSRELVFEKMIPEETVSDTGNVLYDFKQEFAGYPQIAARGRRGDVVEIFCGEELNADGSVRYDMRCNCLYKEKWILSGETDTFEPFDYKAFRFMEIKKPQSCRILSVEGLARHYPFSIKKECMYADKKSQKIFRLCVNTLRYGIQEGYLDCPTREKGQYFGDGAWSAITHVALTGDGSLYKKFAEDAFCSSKIEEGGTAQGPCSYLQLIAEYPLMVVISLKYYLKLTKDIRFVERKKEEVREILSAYAKKYADEEGLVEVYDRWNVVDWPASSRDGYDFDLSQGKIVYGKHNVINGYWYLAIKVYEELYGNKEFDAEKIKRAYNKAFLSEDGEVFFDSEISEHSALASQLFGVLVNGGAKKEAEKRLLTMIEEKRLTASNLFITPILFFWLKKSGNEALLQDLIKDENAWLNMLKEGATTTFEAFSKEGKVNASLFHTMFAFPALFMIKSDLFDREEDER